MNVTVSNSTSTASNSSNSNILVLPWYIALIIVVVSLGGCIFCYCGCIKERKGKRKLHAMIADLKLDDTGTA